MILRSFCPLFSSTAAVIDIRRLRDETTWNVASLIRASIKPDFYRSLAGRYSRCDVDMIAKKAIYKKKAEKRERKTGKRKLEN